MCKYVSVSIYMYVDKYVSVSMCVSMCVSVCEYIIIISLFTAHCHH